VEAGRLALFEDPPGSDEWLGRRHAHRIETGVTSEARHFVGETREVGGGGPLHLL
jgi:hypothetical protein